MENFTPWASLSGGMLIGASASLLLLFNGKVAGISDIVGSLLRPAPGDTAWRLCFLSGLLVGGALFAVFHPAALVMELPRSTASLLAAGLLVGFGTRFGNGCTSGHGVCGISRFSKRSIAATVTFMASGALTVFVVNHILGGSL